MEAEQKKKRPKVSAPLPIAPREAWESLSEDEPVAREVEHMMHFFTCQLRWQYGMMVGEFADFDAEFATSHLDKCKPLMSKFLNGPAKGDRWVPWHTVTCEQELFLMKRVRTIDRLSDEDRLVASFAFSACRCVPLWEEIVVPHLQSPLTPEFFCVGSPFHGRLVEYRNRGNKLHTSAFNCYPPRGASGEAFVDYIAERHVHFAKIGIATVAHVSSRGEQPLLKDLDCLFRSFHRVGPTMSKVLLVTTHLWHPEFEILESGCEVGDGATAAFQFLFPHLQKDLFKKRRHLLHTLHSLLVEKYPTFHRMVKWVAEKSREKFSSYVPFKSIADTVTLYDLQVQLCEWRKFRKSVDPKRTLLKLI